jgi:predicted dehydrogenase
VHASVPLQLTVEANGERTVHTFDTIDQHSKQFETFAHSVLTGAPLPYDARDAALNMAVLDSLFASHREGRLVDVLHTQKPPSR